MLIYCHTFSGNRTEGKDLVPYLLGSMSVLLFDFVGCGNSEGEFLTLGINEAKDLQKIINYIRMEFNTKMVHLWTPARALSVRSLSTVWTLAR